MHLQKYTYTFIEVSEMKKPLVIRPDQIKEVTGLISRSSAYQLERTDSGSPKRVRIGRVSGWLYADLERYLEGRK